MTVLGRLWQIRNELGWAGLAAFALLGVATLFLVMVLKPLETRNEQLEQQLARAARQATPRDGAPVQATSPAARLAAFYGLLRGEEQTTDRLATIHAIGRAAGVEFRSAEYRVHRGTGRIERYEIALPVTGKYSQIRTFLDRSLAEIPVLSLDQVNFKRDGADDASVQAEVRLTLHLVKP
jgi:Tfp pilus assembly protein PilO